MEDLRDRLAHVLWIGGGPNAGKTTLSRLLAGKYDLRIYNMDWHLVRDDRLHQWAPVGWAELSMDDRWVTPTPEAMAERDSASWTGRFTFVVDDLLRLSTERPIVAEGPGAFPWSVSKVIQSPRQAIFLIPTTDVAEEVYRRRHRNAPEQSPHRLTTDPDRARANVRARNELMAQRIVASCDQLGLRYISVDGSSDLDDSLALVEDHFRPHLPATFNV